jgi:hypothetical protein
MSEAFNGLNHQVSQAGAGHGAGKHPLQSGRFPPRRNDHPPGTRFMILDDATDFQASCSEGSMVLFGAAVKPPPLKLLNAQLLIEAAYGHVAWGGARGNGYTAPASDRHRVPLF